MDPSGKTIISWVNSKVASRGMRVCSITDFQDGTVLLALLETLADEKNSPNKIGHYTKAPKMKIQRVENCQIALNFLATEGFALVNIGSDDLASGNEKLTLGLLFQLMERYHLGNKFTEATNALLQWVQTAHLLD